MTSNCHVACDTGNKDNASHFGAILDHQLGAQLCGIVDTHNIDPNQLLMLLKGRLEESYVFIDASAWDADVEFAAEFCFKGCEAFFKRF